MITQGLNMAGINLMPNQVRIRVSPEMRTATPVQSEIPVTSPGHPAKTFLLNFFRRKGLLSAQDDAVDDDQGNEGPKRLGYCKKRRPETGRPGVEQTRQ